MVYEPLTPETLKDFDPDTGLSLLIVKLEENKIPFVFRNVFNGTKYFDNELAVPKEFKDVAMKYVDEIYKKKVKHIADNMEKEKS